MKTKKEKLFHDILETIGVAMVFSIPSSIGPTMPPVENINLLRQSLQEARGVVEPIVLGKKEGKKGIQGFCSGTKIRDQILTVRHCIDGT